MTLNLKYCKKKKFHKLKIVITRKVQKNKKKD